MTSSGTAVLTDVTALPQIPYRGIQPFRYADHPVFFARREETRHLLQLVSVYRGVMLYGDSGVGKSSLINAGLFPAAVQLGFQPERVRVQPRAGEELVVERIPVGDEGGPFLPSLFAPPAETAPLLVVSDEEFAERVRSSATARRPLLVFDQFEELVTLFEETGELVAQQRIADMLSALLREELPVKLLFVFREDYLARVKPLLAAAPELVDQALRLRPPAADALPRIIRGPFEDYPRRFERELGVGLAEQLRTALADRFGSGDISLSEVQTVCLRLWRSDEPEALLAAKGVQGLLEDYLGEELDRFPDDLRYAAGALLSQMVTSAGTRNVIAAEDLIDRVQEEEKLPRDRLERALERLESESKLVRRERRRDLYLYEITSEFLVPWISRRREELVRRQESKRLRRRLALLAALVAGVALVALVATSAFVWARGKQREAERNAVEARGAQLVAQAESLLGTNPAKALDLAQVATNALEDEPELSRDQAMDVLTRAALKSNLDAVFRSEGGPVIAAGFGAGGARLITVRDTGLVEIWNVDEAERVGIFRAEGSVTRALFSRDGAVLAIRERRRWSLWDTSRRRELGRLPSGLLALSPDGRVAVSAVGRPTQGRLHFLGASGLRAGPVLKVERGRYIASVSFTADSREVLGVFTNGGWVVWNGRTGRRTDEIAGPAAERLRNAQRTVIGATTSPDGRLVTVASNEGNVLLHGLVRVYDTPTGRQTRTRWLGVPLSRLASAGDGKLVLAAEDGSAEIWNPRPSGSPISLRGHARPVTSIAVSPDDAWVATASDATATGDQSARIWDTATGELRGTLLGHEDGIRSLAFSPNGRRIVTTSDDGTALLWRTLAAGPDIALSRHRGEVGHASFSHDGRLIMTTSVDGATFLVRASTGELVHSFGRARRLSVGARQFSQTVLGRRPDAVWLIHGPRAGLSDDGTRLITGSDVTGLATMWNARTGKRVSSIIRTPAYPEEAFFDLGPNRRWAAVPTGRFGIRLFDGLTGRPLGRLGGDGYRTWPFAAAASADGRYLVTGDYPFAGGPASVLRVWDVAARQPALVRPVSGTRIRFVAIDAKGAYAAGATWGGTVWIWRVADGKLMATFSVGLPLRALDLAPDGKVVATGTNGSEGELWSVRGTKLRTLNGHRGAINSVEFSRDSSLVVTASDDGTVRVWGVEDGKERAQFRQGRPGRALDASFDRAGRRIAVGASDGSSDVYACPLCGGEVELLEFANAQASRTISPGT